ncbi:hypothetical protein INQ51_05775 [Maribellus sp. CM-23]|uniref:hypothetical protein n=1 Tax=Maribellus sp. CM-23 TaxID=2781026 RepID=UPI001F418D38|nr:hypothetical protein [Maribellus sp. CM-23]MCE4563813.1 hypothetical protein [Maribellus sp. CM-23]
MKKRFSSLTVLVISALILAACSSVVYTGIWKDNEKLDANSYSSIFVSVITSDIGARQIVETDLANALQSKGFKVVKSSDYFNPKSGSMDEATALAKIKSLGCDGILTSALVDEKSEDRYVDGSVTYGSYPVIRRYGRYWSYHEFRYPVYEPGYYTNDKTYFMEDNFYDVESGSIVFSMQSKAVNPSDLKSFSEKYSLAFIKELEKSGLLKAQ